MKGGNILFNDVINTFYLRLYSVGHSKESFRQRERKPAIATTSATTSDLAASNNSYTPSHRQTSTSKPLLYQSWNSRSKKNKNKNKQTNKHTFPSFLFSAKRCSVPRSDLSTSSKHYQLTVTGRKVVNVLFNDALNTLFILRLYGVGHMVKDHSDSERKAAAATWATISD